MQNASDISRNLTERLSLRHEPVAVAFLATPPAGVRKFMGQVPSGCSFWSLAQTAPAGKSAFYTVPSDHLNCPIGSYTHRVTPPAERARELDDALGLMVQIGYVKMEEVPGIPRWPTEAGAIVYARLGEMPVPADVVLFGARPRAAMLLAEAATRVAGAMPAVLPRPTCMAIPAAATQGTALSYACIGNRVYTGLPDDELYVMVRAADLTRIVETLGTIEQANRELAAYHGGRKQNLTVPAQA
jgi:uncharacterized protein (DUF169 family)